ncbi:energy transducer TonB [Flavobacterium sp. NST-5]|uniref:Energy transducer TonB n=1 Tax=Flavobacterium ichthyis TaxID=2698827 RepID=A0ABW9Z782_9FLAO|nr:energy transducer TonB [Flavobacterium ichthyis]NBL64499.1 energy transducer TonB [Flavobacterium ichthyis]
MSTINLFNNSWNEIVFENRNKLYGAYKLRQDDGKTTLKAFLLGTLFCGVLVSLTFIKSNGQSEVIDKNPFSDPITVTDVYLPPVEKPKVTEAAGATEKSSEAQKKYVGTKITENHTTPNEMTTIDQNTTKTGSTENVGDNSGIIGLGITSDNGTGDGKGITETNNNGPELTGDEVMIAVDEKPEFPGGIKSFTALVGKKFRTPEIAQLSKVTVYVSFVVEKDGSLSDIRVTRDPGYGLGNEAIRVLKSIKTKWTPGKRAGKNVRTAFNMPITVQINER